MGPLGDDPPALNQDDPVGQADRGEAMGDYDGRTSGEEVGQALVYAFLRTDVHGAGRIVQDQDHRVGQDRPGDGDPLPLSARQGVAALADHLSVATVEVPDECIGPGDPGGGHHLVTGGIGLPKGDVVV